MAIVCFHLLDTTSFEAAHTWQYALNQKMVHEGGSRAAVCSCAADLALVTAAENVFRLSPIETNADAPMVGEA